MLSVALLLLAAGGVSARNCTTDLIGATLGMCGANHTRFAIFHWKEPCDGGVLPPPVWDLSCDVHCHSGSFLDVDEVLRRSACSLCPNNTYNIGGGEVISGAEGDWTKKRSRYSSYCWTTEWLEWVEGQRCTAWEPTPSGREVLSGEVSQLGAWISTDLVYYANLVRKGQLTVKYSKTTRMLNGFRNGVLSIYINNRPVRFDDSLQRNHWQTVTVELSPGPTEVVINFEKYNKEGQEDVRARISMLEVRGTSYSAHHCFPCVGGTSEAGSDYCTPCPANTHHAQTACVPCSAGKYSSPGSTSEEDCLPRKPCTTEDYGPVFGPCKDALRNLTYRWHEPMICDSHTGVALPDVQTGLPCGLCNPGEYHAEIAKDSGETECRPCPEGTALTESEVTLQCITCLPGTYTPKVWNITTWTPVPEYFLNVCVPRDGENCISRHGWTARGTNLWSGAHEDGNCEIILSRSVNITESNASVMYQLSLDLKGAKSRLVFEVDGIAHSVHSADAQSLIAGPVALSRGVKVLTWIYHRETSVLHPTDSATIHWISVLGLSEGGSPTCAICPSGHYSQGNSEDCKPCPAGYTNTDSRRECEVCGSGMYNDAAGNIKGCTFCPKNTQPSADHTQCIGSPILTWENKTFAVANLTGIEGNLPGYKSGICASNERLKLFCTGTFYGPVADHSLNDFYLSVLNPGDLSFRKYGKFDSSSRGYVWGVLNKTNLPFVQEQDLNMPDDACVSDFSKMIVNMGSKVSYVSGTNDGFSIRYYEGSLCSKSTHERFSTEIAFVCDKTEGDGWPVFLKSEKCTASFVWRTKYACEVCLVEKMPRTKSPCSNGSREVRASETPNCVYPGPASDLIWEEKCNTASELMTSWVGLLGVIALAVFTLAAAILFVCFCKVKKRYELLKNEGDQRGVELT